MRRGANSDQTISASAAASLFLSKKQTTKTVSFPLYCSTVKYYDAW
jgi:hypothetical protein